MSIIDQILDDEDDDKTVLNTEDKDKGKAEEEPDDVIVEGDEEEDDERAAKNKSREDEEGLTDEQKREAKRNRKKRQRERVRLNRDHDKAMIAGLQNTVAELNAKINKLAEKDSDDDLTKVRTAKANAEKRVALIKANIKNAADSGENDKLAELTDQLVEIRADIGKIEGIERSMTEERTREKDDDAEKPDQQEVMRRKAKVVMDNVAVFQSKHDWYVGDDDPEADDDDIADSDMVRKLDAQLTARGSDPSTSQHWKTLEAIIQKRLPHRFEDADEEDDLEDQKAKPATNGKKRPAITGGSGRSSQRSQEGEGYVLSKKRKEAMLEAGIWDDPVKRKRVIDGYKRYDAANKGAN